MYWRRCGSVVLVWTLVLLVSLVGVSVSLYGSSAKVLSLWRVDNARPGATVTLWAKVQNTGRSNLGSGCRVFFWVNGFGTNGVVGSAPCSGLSPGTSQWHKYNWRIPSSPKTGTCKYWAIVKENGVKISRWSEPRQFEVTGPKAQVLKLWQVKDAQPGKTVALWAKVQNTGSSNLDSGCRVFFWVNGSGTNGIVGSTPCSGLSPGTSQWHKYNWRIPSSAKAGTYKYWAVVKYDGQKISKWSSAQSFRVKVPDSPPVKIINGFPYVKTVTVKLSNLMYAIDVGMVIVCTLSTEGLGLPVCSKAAVVSKLAIDGAIEFGLFPNSDVDIYVSINPMAPVIIVPK